MILLFLDREGAAVAFVRSEKSGEEPANAQRGPGICRDVSHASAREAGQIVEAQAAGEGGADVADPPDPRKRDQSPGAKVPNQERASEERPVWRPVQAFGGRKSEGGGGGGRSPCPPPKGHSEAVEIVTWLPESTLG